MGVRYRCEYNKESQRGVFKEALRVRGDILLCESAVKQPGDDGEVAALIVGWENDGVFVLWNGGHPERLLKE